MIELRTVLGLPISFYFSHNNDTLKNCYCDYEIKFVSNLQQDSTQDRIA